MSSYAFARGSIKGFLHEPASGEHGLVLTHGAGANCQSPLLTRAADVFTAAGLYVLRIDLPFRQQRRFGPPSPKTASDDRNGILEAAAELRSIAHGRIFLGGHSYGGRQASMLLAENETIADGLLLLSYPLHPPGKPAELRTAHFPALRHPALFVHGTDDPFGSIAELEAALHLIPAATALMRIDRAGHDLKKGAFDLERSILEPFSRLMLL